MNDRQEKKKKTGDGDAVKKEKRRGIPVDKKGMLDTWRGQKKKNWMK